MLACVRETYSVVLFAAFLIAPQFASAQTLDPEGELHIPELRTPSRLMIGAGGGIGYISGSCTECRALGGAALEFYAGWQFHRRVAVLFDSWSAVHFLPSSSDNPGITFYLVGTASVQAWITPILFLRAGVGIGGLGAQSRELAGYDHGPAFSFVVGGELGHRPNSGIDLSLRASGGPSQYSDPGSERYYAIGVVIGYHRNFDFAARAIDQR